MWGYQGGGRFHCGDSGPERKGLRIGEVPDKGWSHGYATCDEGQGEGSARGLCDL